MLCTRNALTVNMLCSDIVLHDFIIACIVSYLHNWLAVQNLRIALKKAVFALGFKNPLS